jgi:hypothetical protein
MRRRDFHQKDWCCGRVAACGRAQQPAMPRIGWLGGGVVDAYVRAIVFLARRGVTVRFTMAGVTSRCGFAM